MAPLGNEIKGWYWCMAPLGNKIKDPRLEYRLPFSLPPNDEPVCANREIRFQYFSIPHVHYGYCKVA